MLTRLGIVVALTLAAALAAATPAWATLDNLKRYKQTYPSKKPKAYSCKTCHEHPVGNKTDLNGYGKALEQLPAPTNPKKLTIDDFRAAESADPDQDGATTLQELQAGTDPSDPASVPPPAAAGSTTETSTGPAAGTEAPKQEGAPDTTHDQAPKQPEGP